MTEPKDKSLIKHTGLPWTILRALDHEEYAMVFGWNQQHVGTEFVIPTDIRLENAEYIVKCCNAFPAMMEAVKEIDDFYENSVGQVITTERAIDAYHKSTMADKIKAAIAAGGE